MRYFARVCLDGLRYNRVRSAFTGLGVLVGVTAVVLILTLTHSFFAHMGSSAGDRFTVGLSSSAEANRDVVAAMAEPAIAARRDALLDRPDIARVDEVAAADRVQVALENGALAELPVAFTDDVPLTEGVGFGETTGNVAIAYDNPEFSGGVLLGSTIHVDGAAFAVVGLTNSLGENGSTRLFLPERMAAAVETDTHPVGASFSVVVADPAKLASVRTEVVAELNEGLDPDLKFIDYSAEESAALAEVSSSLGLFLGLIAAISLAVAALNIVNVMYISTLERADEVAIYRSMGMTRPAVVYLFLFESVVVVTVFAVAGVLLGHLIAAVVLVVLEVPMVFSLATVAILLLVIIGIGAGGGLYPASQAARIDPVRLLR